MTLLSIITCNFLVASFIGVLYLIELGINRKKSSSVEPMQVRTTYPAYKPPFNMWVKFMQSKGIFISTNQDFKIK